MLADTLALFLGLSLILYCVLAGADFGAGILDFFIFKKSEESDQDRKLISNAIAPVWETNHIWIILALVILFTAFPKAYSSMSVSLHVPLTLMLIGIILRGSAFAFGRYDAVKDRSQIIYSRVFVLSSIMTPIFLGIVVGAITLARFKKNGDYFDMYISPWLNCFSVSVGIFLCSLFAFLASIFLIGETSDPNAKCRFRVRAKITNMAAMICGGFVFVAARVSHFDILSAFTHRPISIATLMIATLLLIPLWISVRNGQVMFMRIWVGLQIACVLIGWFALQYPTMMKNNAGELITIANGPAPTETLTYLLYELGVGSLIIFPAIVYLFFIFKRSAR